MMMRNQMTLVPGGELKCTLGVKLMQLMSSPLYSKSIDDMLPPNCPFSPDQIVNLDIEPFQVPTSYQSSSMVCMQIL